MDPEIAKLLRDGFAQMSVNLKELAKEHLEAGKAANEEQRKAEEAKRKEEEDWAEYLRSWGADDLIP